MRGGFVRRGRESCCRRFHRADAVGDGFQDSFDAFAEPRNGILQHGATRLLLAEQSIFSFRRAALRDVVVGSDPIIGAGYRPVDDRDGSPIRRLGDEAQSLSGSHVSKNFRAILRRIASQVAGFATLKDDIQKRSAGLHNVRGQAIHAAVLIVADQEPSRHVEHDDALGHVIEHERQQVALMFEPQTPGPSRQMVEDTGHRR